MDKSTYAAIAMVLYKYRGNNVHSIESDEVTIKPKQSMWDAKFVSLTEKPRQCGAR